MKISRIFIPVLVAVTLLLMPIAATSVFAADSTPPAESGIDHSLDCADGVCSLRVDLGDKAVSWLPTAGFALSVLEENLNVLPDGAGITINDGVSLDMPIGNLKLTNASMDLKMGENGQIDSFYGTANLPSPSLGSLGLLGLPLPLGKKSVATTIGYDEAANLPGSDLPLDSNKKYLFFELASGTELEATVGEAESDTLWLSVPEGQKATVIIDPQERFAYIDGNVTMRYSGVTAFFTQMLDPAETVDILSGELPIRHQASVHVSGVLSDDLNESELTFAGRYSVDGGKLAELVKLDGEPLALEGGLVISDAGVLGTGVVRSTLLPESVWDSTVQAQVFVPFSADFSDAYVALNSSVNVPIANLSADGYAKLNGALDVVAEGNYSVPWRRLDTDLLAENTAVDADSTVVQMSISGSNEAQDIDGSESNRWAKIWDATSSGVQSGITSATPAAKSAAGWVKENAGAGYESAADSIGWTIDMTSSQWCETTGFCRDGGADSATAMR